MNAATHSTPIAPPLVPFLAVPRRCGDDACKLLSPMAFKLWYRITRMTRGWQREEAAISYDDFKHACGIKASSTISRALKELLNKGFIAASKHVAERGKRFSSTTYSLLNPPETASAPRAPSAARAEASSLPARSATPPADWKVSGTPRQAQRLPTRQAPAPDMSNQYSPSDFHRLIDQVELPIGIASAAEGATEEPEEEEQPALGSAYMALRQELDAVIRQGSLAYMRMVMSPYNTLDYQVHKRHLLEMRAEERRLRKLLEELT